MSPENFIEMVAPTGANVRQLLLEVPAFGFGSGVWMTAVNRVAVKRVAVKRVATSPYQYSANYDFYAATSDERSGVHISRVFDIDPKKEESGLVIHGVLGGHRAEVLRRGSLYEVTVYVGNLLLSTKQDN